MISSQVLQNAIDELRSITRIDLCVFDPEGRTVVSTFNGEDISKDMVCLFNDSAADSQVIQGYHFFKIFDSPGSPGWKSLSHFLSFIHETYRRILEFSLFVHTSDCCTGLLQLSTVY